MSLLDWSHQEAALSVSQEIFRREASADQCRSVAGSLGILACRSITAEYKILILPNGRYRVSGTFCSSVEQACVISLEPVRSDLSGRFDIEFWPEAQLLDAVDIELGDPDTEDPEPIISGRLEVGRLIYELLALRLDPYPRKYGEGFDMIEAQPNATRDNNPFAKLASLKNRDDGKG